MFGGRELFLTFDAAALLNVTRKLDEADIEYEIRTDDLEGPIGDPEFWAVWVRIRVRKSCITFM